MVIVIAVLSLIPVSVAGQGPSSVTGRMLFSFPDVGSFGVEADIRVISGLSVVGTVQRWSRGEECFGIDVFASERPTCKSDGESLGGGIRLTAASDDSYAPFVQVEGGRHRFDEDEFTSSFWSVRAGVTWRIGPRSSFEVGFNHHKVGGMGARTLASVHALVGVRIG